MGKHLQILIPTINAIPKINGSLFKIYRDSRFHLNSPIKEKIGIIFWQGSGHRMQSSSFYMHYSPQGYFVATGIRNFKPPLLMKYREYIQDDIKRVQLHEILEELNAKGYKLPKPKFKRYPKGFNKDDKYSYLYLMDAIFSYTQKPLNDNFFSKNIITSNIKIYQDMLPLFEWLYELTL